MKYFLLYKALGYSFRNTRLLKEAMTRRSAIEEGHPDAAKRDYQILEFLGDRVLNFFITQILMHHFPDINSGELSDLKIQCIANQGLLAQIARSISLEKYIIRGRGETELTDKMYADAMEALLGAVYLDTNKNDHVLLTITEHLLSPHLPSLEIHVISSLLEKTLTITLAITPRRSKQIASIIQRGTTHFDDGIFQFRKRVLNWSFDSLKHPLPVIRDMQHLPASYPDYNTHNRLLYYANLRDLILEESRAILQSGLESITAGKAKAFTLKTIKFKAARNTENPSTFIMAGKLPKDFEHGTSNIAVLLHPATQETSELRLLGLASYQEIETQENKFEVKTVISPGSQIMNPKLFAPEACWQAYILGSLVTQQRMYDICTKMPQTNFEQQLIQGQLILASRTMILDCEDQGLLAKLNCSQQDAVTRFLSTDTGLQLLQGPPGTGKTTTIITILQLLCRRQMRILVCAPSNKAVQLLASRFLQANPETAITLAGVKSKVPAELYPIFLHTWGKDICKRIGECIVSLNKLRTDEKLTQQVFLSTMQQTVRILSYISASIAKTASSHNNPQLWEQIFAHTRQLISNKIDEDIKKPLETICTFLTNIQARIAMANQSKDTNNAPPLEIEILNHAQIVFSTLSTSGRKSIQEMESIDVLIIDEASQAVEAETLIPFALNPKKCLLVGDTKQLPATVLSQPAVDLGFHWSLMWRLLEECKQEYTMLTIQYRMHPEIRHWPSRQYYDNKLEDAESIKSSVHLISFDYPPILAPCSFIDVKGNEDECGYSYINRQEAEHIMAILYYLNKKGVNIKSQVGVITFYAGQVEYLSSLIQQHPEYQGMTVHTVDGFQGDERDFIILSFVRANPKGRVGFVRDFRRLNVAITRAKSSLVMLGNIATLHTKKSDIAALIDNMRERNLVWPEGQLFQTLVAADDPRYKTQLCRHFFTSHCNHGDRCHFAHSQSELRTFTASSMPKPTTFREQCQPLCDTLRYYFKDIELLRQALTRQNAIEEKLYDAASYSYQKLKFFGDHVLKLVIATLLTEKLPASGEGELHTGVTNR